LNFTLLGDPMNPNGGLLERFVGLNIPSAGLEFYGATPGNSFPTKIYTAEYDGYADFPQYPIDIVSDLNAFIGSTYVHGSYPMMTQAQLATAVTLPTSGPTTTTYYMIPTPDLPLLAPLRAIPVIGNPIADLLQPDMTVLVDLGYGSTTQGWSPGPANVPTPFGVIPPVSPVTVANALATGTQQGIAAFGNDVSTGIAGLPSLANSLPSLTSIGSGGMGGGPSVLPTGLPSALSSPDSFIQALQTANTTVVDAISSGAANGYAVLLPTADLANALVTSFPSYDVNLFLTGIEQAVNGDPVNGLVYAFGAPVAADLALGTFAAGLELEIVLDAAGISL
jgi:PE-PPE domain